MRKEADFQSTYGSNRAIKRTSSIQADILCDGEKMNWHGIRDTQWESIIPPSSDNQVCIRYREGLPIELSGWCGSRFLIQRHIYLVIENVVAATVFVG